MDNKSIISEIHKVVIEGVNEGVHKGVNNVASNHNQYEIDYEFDEGIIRAIKSMKELKCKDSDILQMIVKYWDICYSDAESYLDYVNNINSKRK